MREIIDMMTMPTSQLRVPPEALASDWPPRMAFKIKKPIKTIILAAAGMRE
jgi:hypothetical protein